jgi:ATP-dependent DNA ligase
MSSSRLLRLCKLRSVPSGTCLRKGPRGGAKPLTAEKMQHCRWVKPKLICQVAFVEWTDAGHLRHCTFVAMRVDKKAAEVHCET